MAAPQLGARISVIGNSGAGKSTMARLLSARLDMPRLELDAVNHQPNWTTLEPGEFRRRVREFVARPRWVIDGNYTAVGALDIIWERAETVIWLDLPRALVVSRVARRSLRRVLTGEQLWNGNRERLGELLSLDSERSIVAWAWVHFAGNRAKFERRCREPRWRHLQIIRLRSPAQVRAWLDSVGPLRS
ncbi:MAG TPA: hypothetical protein VK034_15135 [Enhygromyxa sp.]|nr:hypothetical protein [Enhygromyxa sp.]